MKKQIQEPLLQEDTTPKAEARGSMIGGSQIGIEDQDQSQGSQTTMPPPEPKNPGVLIDFREEMQNLKKNTEISAPFIQTVCEDAMFLNKTQVVTLEFHKYQTSQKYIKLDNNLPENFDEHSHSHIADNRFQTSLFPTRQQVVKTHENYNTAFFGNDPENDENDNVVSYIPVDMKLSDSKHTHLLKVENITEAELEQRAIDQKKLSKTPRSRSKSKAKQTSHVKDVETNYAEGIICLYQINLKGSMKKINETSINMSDRFHESKDGNMTLTRSTDKKVFSLVNFDKYDPNERFFKFQAWKINLKQWLPESGKMDELEEGLNQYYKKVVNNFEKLVSVQLVNNCTVVKLEYIEKELSEEEMNALVMKIFKYNRAAQEDQTKTATGEKIRRKVTKHVFFDVNSGKILFEYGGINKKAYTGTVEGISNLLFDPETSKPDEKKIYELSLQIKEIKEQKFKSYLVFYYTGDFLNDAVKSNQLIFKWAINHTFIPMNELFALREKGQQAMMNYVYEAIYKQIQETQADPFTNDCFVFDQNIIQKQRLLWEQSVVVSTNRTFDQFMVINQPVKRIKNCFNTVYLNGQQFKNIDLNKTVNDASQNKTQRQRNFEVPFYNKLPSKPDDMIIRPGRNNFIKDELYYEIEANDRLKPFCLRIEDQDPDQRVKQIRLSIGQYRSQPDCMLNYNKNFQDDFQVDVFQTIHVSNQSGQEAIFQTRLPTKISDKKVKNYEIVVRKTSQAQQTTTNFPIIAYNLGDQKLAFHCLLGNHIGKNYIMDFDPTERFLGFVEYNQFEDIGFYPKNLTIECCSSFIFMTTTKEKSKSAKNSNKLYLMLIDPYYKDIEVVKFKSALYFEHQFKSQDDFVIKSILQNSSVRKSPTSQDGRCSIWSQFPKDLVMIKLRNVYSEEEDEESEHDDENMIEDQRNQDDMEDTMPGKSIKEIQEVEIKQDSCDFIYYVVCQNEELQVMEINPRDPSYDKHLCIYRHISNKCRAFTIKDADCFFMVDNKLNIFKLTRSEQSRFLNVEKKMALKEIQRAEFSPRPFEKLICRESYAICKSKIFYFYDLKTGPKADGLMDSEDLVDARTLKRYDPNINYELVKGPILITGSSRFFCIFRLTNGKDLPKYIYWVMHRLEQAQKTLVNDISGNVKFSTFLENGNILVQCAHRFLVFTCKGSFIEEAEFENEEFFLQENENNGQGDSTQVNFFKQAQDKDEDEESCRADQSKIILSKELLQLSQNLQYYAFYDKKYHKIVVYKMLWQYGHTSFVPQYELSHEDNQLFDHLKSKDIDPIAYLIGNPGQIRVTNDGKVKICYTEVMDDHEVEEMKDEIYENARRKSCCKIAPRHEYNFNDKGMLYCKIFGTFFRQLESSEGDFLKISGVRNFYDTFLFPESAVDQMNETQQNQIDEKIKKLNRIEYTQSMIPDIYKNFNEQENLSREIKRLQKTMKKSTQINAKIFFDFLVIIYGGRYIKFGHLIENPKPRQKGQQTYNYFIFKENSDGSKIKDINAQLCEKEEVIKITETDSGRHPDPSKRFHLAQITTKDWENKIMKLISWNFDLNMEESNLQMPYNPQEDSGHLIKGMVEKRNYYYCKDFIIDLEFNIPLLQRNLDQALDFKTQNYITQVQTLDIMMNQRKLYSDRTMFLGIERPNILYNSLCKLDVLLWRNIQDLGSRPEDIKDLCTVDSINLNFSGNSLFHYFADDPDIIQIFYDKYKEEESKCSLSSCNMNLPLQILNPNNQGFTALQIANQKQQPRSLELMFMMIQDLPNYAVTKMFIAEIPMLLAHESESILNFFEKSFFAPLQMRLPQFVPWETDASELVFASHTAIMSQELLISKMKEQGFCPKDYQLSEKSGEESTSMIEDTEETGNNQMFKKRSMNLTQLIDDQESKSGNTLTRVEIRSIDMDWLFIDQNSKKVLELLAESSNPKVLVKSQIRIFVDLMWSQYKPNIINYIFIPYIGYLAILLYMSAKIIGPYQKSLEEPLTPEEHQEKYGGLKFVTMVTLFVATCFLNMNIILELQQVQKNGMEYFESYWNMIDIGSLGINFMYIATFAVNFVRAQEFFPIQVIRVIGGFAAFTMWIKVFYWMRLFPDLAYYVKLISQTILDSMSFSLLVFIILISFANFFYIINKNNPPDGDVNYVTEITGYSFLDAILDVYLMGALGAFETSTFQNGFGAKFAIPMLFLATFFISIVFMNMLIAIMGETFAQVQESAEENGLLERVNLINDFIWLIDLRKIFKGHKYIIQVMPMQNQIEETTAVDLKLQDMDTCLSNLILNEHFVLKQIISRTDDMIQKNQNDLVKTQDWMMRQIKSVKTQLKAQQAKLEEQVDAFQEQEQIDYSYLHMKTLEIIIALNKQLNDSEKLDTSPEGIYDIAFDWVSLVDKNNQGGINLTEFYRSFSCIDDFVISDKEIVSIFKMFDVNGDGDITVQELAKSIQKTIDFCLKEGGQELIDRLEKQDGELEDALGGADRDLIRQKAGATVSMIK